MTEKKMAVPVEVYSRVVGYFRPVNQWNKGKQQEYRERRVYNIPELAEYSEFGETVISQRSLVREY